MDLDFGDLDLGDVTGWIAALLAVGAIVVSLRANHFAKKSAKAAVDSAEYARRSADAAERQALAAEQAVPPPPPPVAWQIRHLGKHSWALRNIGTQTATGVKIQEHEDILDVETGDGSVAPGASMKFWALLADSEIWVSWDGQPEAIPVPVPA